MTPLRIWLLSAGVLLTIGVSIAGLSLLDLGPKCTTMCNNSHLKNSNIAKWIGLCYDCCDETMPGTHCYTQYCDKLKDPVKCKRKLDIPPCTDVEPH